MQSKQWYHVGTLSSTALLFLWKADPKVTTSTDVISHITSILHCDQHREESRKSPLSLLFPWPRVIIRRDLLCKTVAPFLGVSLCSRWQMLAQCLSDREVTQQPHKVLVRHSLTTSSDQWLAAQKREGQMCDWTGSFTVFVCFHCSLIQMIFALRPIGNSLWHSPNRHTLPVCVSAEWWEAGSHRPHQQCLHCVAMCLLHCQTRNNKEETQVIPQCCTRGFMWR